MSFNNLYNENHMVKNEPFHSQYLFNLKHYEIAWLPSTERGKEAMSIHQEELIKECKRLGIEFRENDRLKKVKV